MTNIASQDTPNIAAKAILKILAPVVEFGLDAGLSARHLQSILRLASVLSVVSSQRKSGFRPNISGVAAATGIPRSEVSRLIKTKSEFLSDLFDHQQQPTRKVLAAWNKDPKFCGPSGKPSDLTIFGPGLTFESLVKKYGGGLPTRAVLDELTRARAVKVLSSGRLRALKKGAENLLVTSPGIRFVGQQAQALLSILVETIAKPESCMITRGRCSIFISPSALKQLRKEMSANESGSVTELAIEFLCKKILTLAESKKTNGKVMAVTIFLHGGPAKERVPVKVLGKRQNFRRED